MEDKALQPNSNHQMSLLYDGLDIAEWRVNELGGTQMMWGGPSADLHIIASHEGFPLLGKVSENSWPIQI